MFGEYLGALFILRTFPVHNIFKLGMSGHDRLGPMLKEKIILYIAV
jgi:hypothetical protein